MLTLDYRPTESSAGCTKISSESCHCLPLTPHLSPSPSFLSFHKVDCDSREKDCLREVSNPTHQPSGETLCSHLLCAHRVAAGCATPLSGLDTPVLQHHWNNGVRVVFNNVHSHRDASLNIKLYTNISKIMSLALWQRHMTCICSYSNIVLNF